MSKNRFCFLIFVILIIFFSSCTNNDSKNILLNDSNKENGVERAYRALRNKVFTTQISELKSYYGDGEVIYNPDCSIGLFFNNDSLVYLSALRDKDSRPAIYRIREVNSKEDAHFDNNPKHYIAEFYTQGAELIRLTFGYGLDFENDKLDAANYISISSQIFDFNAVDKLEKIINSKNINPWASDAEVLYKQLAKKYVGTRQMQFIASVKLNKDNDWTNPDWSNPIAFYDPSTSPEPDYGINSLGAQMGSDGFEGATATISGPTPDYSDQNQAQSVPYRFGTILPEKAYFYSNPDPSTIRSAYVVAGDEVEIFEKAGTFYLCEFENMNGKITKGWMRGEDLELMQYSQFD